MPEGLKKVERIEAGTVERVLPRRMFAIRLDTGRSVRAGLAAGATHSVVRILVGERVQVRIGPQDPSRGQIVGKI